jgi:hypothetical protein
MITVRTSPQYVNRVRQDWMANGGVYGDGGISALVPSNDPFAQLGPTLDLTFAGNPTDLLTASTTAGYTLDTYFTPETYQIAVPYAIWEDGVGLSQKTFAQIVTFTRASTATFFNSAGTLTSAAVNEARFDYNPSTLAPLGFLIEEARTNSIRNNTMVGAVAGTPGTLPTNGWAYFSTAGLTTSVIGTGTQNGINYIDLRLNGTTTNTFIVLAFDSVAAAASSGQVWTESFWVSLVGGSTANITSVNVNLRQTGGATPTFDIPFTPTATFTRVAGSGTLAAGATGATAALAMFCNNGAAIDITLRIGLPQLEQGAFATSVIPTTTTALTRSADVASVNTLSPWYNATEGTIYAETQLISTVARNAAGFDLNDGTTNNRNIFRALTTGGADQNIVRSGGVSVASLASVSTPTTAVRKSASAYAVNNFAFTANGGTPSTSVSGAVPVGLNVMLLGSGVAASEFLGGYLRRITYYPRRLSNADLQTITT